MKFLYIFFFSFQLQLNLFPFNVGRFIRCVRSKGLTAITKLMHDFQKSAQCLTSEITPRSRVLFVWLTDVQLVHKFPSLYGIRRLTTAVTIARQLSLSLVNLDSVHVSTSHFLKIYFNTETALYRLLTFHVPNLMTNFRCTTLSVKVWDLLFDCFATQFVFMVRSC